MAKAICFILLAAVSQMINFFDYTLVESEGSYWKLWGRLLRLYWSEWTYGFGNSYTCWIWPWITVGSVVSAMYFIVLSFSRNVLYFEAYEHEIQAQNEKQSGTQEKIQLASATLVATHDSVNKDDDDDEDAVDSADDVDDTTVDDDAVHVGTPQ